MRVGAPLRLPERADDAVRRRLGADPGYLIAWSPGGAGRLVLDLASGPAPAPQLLELALDALPLLTTTLPADGRLRRVVSPPLALARGWYRFRLSLPGAGPGSPTPAIALYRAAWAPGP